MKAKLLIAFALLLTIIVGTSTLKAQEKTKYYILFDNFEDQKAGNTTITNLIDLCYWDPMRTDIIYGPYTERAPFGAATFNKKPITDYDVAVFPMGTTLGLDAAVDGIKVIDKIYEMLDAGKTVLIIGNAVVIKGFSGSDSKVKEFLSNYLGIEYPLTNKYIQSGRVALTDGSNIWGAVIDGIQGDPIAKGFDKVINQAYNLNNGGFRDPVRLYTGIDVMGLKSNSTSVGFDFVSVVKDDSVDVSKDMMWTGIRHENGTARVALWTTNFDIANTWHTLYYNEALMGAFEWGTRDVPRPEKYIKSENMQVNFGKVEPNSKAYKAIAFQNFGRTPLKVSKMEVIAMDEEGIFEITDGNEAVTLEPNEIHSINLQFKPLDTKTYNDALDISSDAVNGTLSIELYGTGGTNTEFGPKIAVTDVPVDFGSIDYTKYGEKNIAIASVGDQDLVVDDVQFVKNGNDHFSFPTTMQFPVIVKAGKTWYFQVRFATAQSDSNGGKFNGELLIKSNALNGTQKTILLQATANSKNAKTGLTLSANEIDFGKVNVGDSTTFTLTISNKGGADLIFPVKPSFVGGGEIKAQYSFVGGSEIIPTLAPNQSHDLKIQFKPLDTKLYNLSMKLTSNDQVNPITNIAISGEGQNPVSVEESTLSKELALQIKPSVNNGNAIFSYDYTGELDRNVDVRIIDITGKVRMNLYNGAAIKGIHFINLNNLNFESGKYFVVVEMDGINKMIPFIIQK
ncbi:MAG TPA: choice-of-anchor D domain-containing protein [Candidatus Kapabacteria bacterium]|nr:choice-of-anchor D domain-containing protein [Candidatus Kapabacteria bacterium]